MDYKRNGKPQGTSWHDDIGWHMERGKGVGGSEIAILVGDSPWGTPFKLWEYKTGEKESKSISHLPHIQRGILGEKICRKILEAQSGLKFEPHTWSIEGKPYRCSDDGFNSSISQLLEIKCMSVAAHGKFKEAVNDAKTQAQKIKAIPSYYLHQCLWNIFVADATSCLFISFDPATDEMVKVLVKPNQKVVDKYIKLVDKFWGHVVSKKPPALSDKDQVETTDEKFLSLEKEWLVYKDDIDLMTVQLKEVEEKLKAFTSKHAKIKGRLAQVSKCTTIGRIDYKRALSEHKIDADSYRGEPTESIRISRVKQSE